jgi:hypothetical protein
LALRLIACTRRFMAAAGRVEPPRAAAAAAVRAEAASLAGLAGRPAWAACVCGLRCAVLRCCRRPRAGLGGGVIS